MKTLWVAGLLAASCWAQSAPGQDAKAARGKYLVEQVAKCQDCHTPKMENGEFIRSQWMKGSTLGFTPVAPIPNWHAKSPDVTANSAVMKRWGCGRDDQIP